MSTVGRFTRLERIGEGTYGAVYKARTRSSGRVVALKRMAPAPEEEGVPATTIREIAILKEMNHPNIIRLRDVLFQPPKLTLVFDYADQDLKKFLSTTKAAGARLAPDVIRKIMLQLLNGVEYMHSCAVAHRDLKPQNLLLTNDLLQIADFGLARVDGIPVKKYSHEAVTLWYRAPDVILGSCNYGFSVDTWSVGCILAELITLDPVFNGKTDVDQLHRIFKLLGTPRQSEYPEMKDLPGAALLTQPTFNQVYESTFSQWAEQWQAHDLIGDEGIDLLLRLMRTNPAHRLTASQALAHPYFHGTANGMPNVRLSPTGTGRSATAPAADDTRQHDEAATAAAAAARRGTGGQDRLPVLNSVRP